MKRNFPEIIKEYSDALTIAQEEDAMIEKSSAHEYVVMYRVYSLIVIYHETKFRSLPYTKS